MNRRSVVGRIRTRSAGGRVFAVGLAALVGLPSAAFAAPNAGGGVASAVCPQHVRPGHETCFALRRTDVPARRSLARPATAPAGYAPADLASAYNLPGRGRGGGTVAIVDAYDNPNVEADLAVYRAQFGLTPCTSANGCFSKVNQRGATTGLPIANTGWAAEIALDTDMVSAACPGCRILLVEADSDADADLGAAENYAAAQAGVVAISNSFGEPETADQPALGEKYFHHPRVAVVASAGDSGFTPLFPAALPYVIAVGGTALHRASNARGWTESVWSTNDLVGTGSGCSAYEPKPRWQTDTGCPRRTVSDIGAVADPATGVAVYDSYGSGGWAVFGGTSAAAPLVAAMYAMADDPAASARSLYNPANGGGLNDVTMGQNSTSCTSYLCRAQLGYDGPTGNGTPNGLAAFTR